MHALNASGVQAELWRYPDRTTAMGQMINSYLQSKCEMDGRGAGGASVGAHGLGDDFLTHLSSSLASTCI